MAFDLNRGMLKLYKYIFLIVFTIGLSANDFNFDLIKKGTDDNNTLLVIGGIQGDEPGGFISASLLSTHYEITKGSVWIVPNLNFYSIIKSIDLVLNIFIDNISTLKCILQMSIKISSNGMSNRNLV